MLRYLLRGMDAVSNKVVNYDKMREITQHYDEIPALFLNRLQDALVKYTRLDPGSPNGATVLASHFISQSAPDIRKKLKKVEEGPETPIQDLVKMAFKVFNAREETAEAARQARLQQKAPVSNAARKATGPKPAHSPGRLPSPAPNANQWDTGSRTARPWLNPQHLNAGEMRPRISQHWSY
ncbi:uncharacterized protein WM277_015422 isoform 2-T2 [Molossus nigricans]